MLDKDTEQVIQEFESIHAAETYLGKTSTTHISSVCKGKRKSAFGFKWKFKEDN